MSGLNGNRKFYSCQCNWRGLSLRISASELTILDLSIATGSLDSSSTQVFDLANEACVWLTAQGQRDHNLSSIRRQDRDKPWPDNVLFTVDIF